MTHKQIFQKLSHSQRQATRSRLILDPKELSTGTPVRRLVLLGTRSTVIRIG